jgi:hypothetical protein
MRGLARARPSVIWWLSPRRWLLVAVSRAASWPRRAIPSTRRAWLRQPRDGRASQLNTDRDRDIFRVDEDIEQDIALVRHDGHLGRASVLAPICG